MHFYYKNEKFLPLWIFLEYNVWHFYIWCQDVFNVILEQTFCRNAIGIKHTASASFAVERKKEFYTV